MSATDFNSIFAQYYKLLDIVECVHFSVLLIPELKCVFWDPYETSHKVVKQGLSLLSLFYTHCSFSFLPPPPPLELRNISEEQ